MSSISRTEQSFPNGADLSAAVGLLVKTPGGLVKTSAATDVPLGVLLANAPDSDTSGHILPVCLDGLCRVKIGAAVTAGGFLTMDSSGRAIDTSATTDVIIGRALETGDAANDFILAHISISPARGS